MTFAIVLRGLEQRGRWWVRGGHGGLLEVGRLCKYTWWWVGVVCGGLEWERGGWGGQNGLKRRGSGLDGPLMC